MEIDVATLLLTAVGTVIGIALAFVGTSFTFYKLLKSSTKETVESLKNEMLFRFENIGNDIFKLEQQTTKIDDRVFRLNERIAGRSPDVSFNVRSKFIGEHSDKFRDAKTAEENSPTTLNPKGQDIAKYLRAEPIVEKYVNRILIPDDADQLAIQNICFTFAFDSLMNVLNKDEVQIIRDAIYREGSKGGSADVLMVYGVLFRDHYLKERGFPVPEYIKPSEAISQ